MIRKIGNMTGLTLVISFVVITLVVLGLVFISTTKAQAEIPYWAQWSPACQASNLGQGQIMECIGTIEQTGHWITGTVDDEISLAKAGDKVLSCTHTEFIGEGLTGFYCGKEPGVPTTPLYAGEVLKIQVRNTVGTHAQLWPQSFLPTRMVSITVQSEPVQPTTGITVNLRAEVAPPWSSHPIEYLWQVDDLGTFNGTAGAWHDIWLQWETPGMKTVRVTATSAYGSVTTETRIEVLQKIENNSITIFLPLVMKGYSPSPQVPSWAQWGPAQMHSNVANEQIVVGTSTIESVGNAVLMTVDDVFQKAEVNGQPLQCQPHAIVNEQLSGWMCWKTNHANFVPQEKVRIEVKNTIGSDAGYYPQSSDGQ